MIFKCPDKSNLILGLKTSSPFWQTPLDLRHLWHGRLVPGGDRVLGAMVLGKGHGDRLGILCRRQWDKINRALDWKGQAQRKRRRSIGQWIGERVRCIEESWSVYFDYRNSWSKKNWLGEVWVLGFLDMTWSKTRRYLERGSQIFIWLILIW